MSTRIWAGIAALALAGCGGGGGGGGTSDPPPVEESDVTMPVDAPSAIKRCQELLNQLVDPLKLGKELPAKRPIADELAIVANKIPELAAAGFAPEIVNKLAGRCRDAVAAAQDLAKYLREGDAGKATTVHQTLVRLFDRIQGDLPRGTAPAKDE